MTVAASATYELTIDQVVRNAYVLAGLRPIEQGTSGIQWQQQSAYGRGLLEMILKGLEAEQLLVRRVGFHELTLVAGTAAYSLPANVLDVSGDAAYIAAGEDVDAADSETPVKQIDRAQWQGLGGRTGEGVPSLYYPHREGAQVEVRLWLTPDEAGTIRFQAHFLSANATDGAATLDAERHWARYLTYELAADLAEPVAESGKVLRLRQQASVLLMKAKGLSRPRTGLRVRLAHPGPWGNR